MQYKFSDIWTKDIVKSQLILLDYCRKINADAFLIGIGTDYTEQKIFDSWHTTKKRHKISKSEFSAFASENLNEELLSIGSDYLVLMGVNSCSCVYETAKSAVRLGYNVGLSKETTNDINDGWLKWYKSNTDLFDTTKDLITYIDNNLSL